MQFRRLNLRQSILCSLHHAPDAFAALNIQCRFAAASSSSTPPIHPSLPDERSIARIVAQYVTTTTQQRGLVNVEQMPVHLLVQEVAKTYPSLSNPYDALSSICDSTSQLLQFTSNTSGEQFVKLRGVTAQELIAHTTSDAGKGEVFSSPVDLSPFTDQILTMAEEFLKNTTVNSTVYMAADALYQHIMKSCALYAPGQPLKDIVAKKLELTSFISMLGIDEKLFLEEKAPTSDRIQKHLVRHRFWVFRYHDSYYIARRLDGTQDPPYFRILSGTKMSSAVSTMRREFGGWGGALNVPTKDDVYEILKYVPVHWGNFSNLSIPPAIRKKHIRSSSPLMWFRRQPCYFELREINYTTEIRRSIVLHPEAHQLTAQEANELLSLRMVFWEANSLIPLDSDGKPLEEQSSFEKNVHKFFSRVCPTYFSPLGIILQRYTKKNMTIERLLGVAQAAPHDFETVHPKFANEVLVRRRGGADSERWRGDFLKDLESCAADVPNIIDVFNVLTPMWDRPEYVYVRLSQKTQERLKGYDGLLQLLRRHPQLFRVGDHFVCRVDPSNPLAIHSKEPLPDDMTSRTRQCEENPYLSPLELAKVFHYVAPPHEGCTVSFLVDAASPAMRVALPPQVITVLQQFPRLFACKENSPGDFVIYKLTPSTGSSRAPTPRRESDNDECTPDEGEEDDSWILEEAQVVGKELSKNQAIEEVYALVPDSGVSISQLLLWTSLPVQQAASFHYGGLLKMIESHGSMFRIEDTADGKMIYRASV